MRKIEDVMEAMMNSDEIIYEARKEYFETKREAKESNFLLRFIRRIINM